MEYYRIKLELAATAGHGGLGRPWPGCGLAVAALGLAAARRH